MRKQKDMPMLTSSGTCTGSFSAVILSIVDCMWSQAGFKLHRINSHVKLRTNSRKSTHAASSESIASRASETPSHSQHLHQPQERLLPQIAVRPHAHESKGLFTTREINRTYLQQADPVTRRVHWSRESASRLDWL